MARRDPETSPAAFLGDELRRARGGRLHDGLADAGFAIADVEDGPGMGYQETALRGMPVTDPKELAALAVAFDRLRGGARVGILH
jgi:hypothetical protein